MSAARAASYTTTRDAWHPRRRTASLTRTRIPGGERDGYAIIDIATGKRLKVGETVVPPGADGILPRVRRQISKLNKDKAKYPEGVQQEIIQEFKSFRGDQRLRERIEIKAGKMEEGGLPLNKCNHCRHQAIPNVF